MEGKFKVCLEVALDVRYKLPLGVSCHLALNHKEHSLCALIQLNHTILASTHECCCTFFSLLYFSFLKKIELCTTYGITFLSFIDGGSEQSLIKVHGRTLTFPIQLLLIPLIIFKGSRLARKLKEKIQVSWHPQLIVRVCLRVQ